LSRLVTIATMMSITVWFISIGLDEEGLYRISGLSTEVEKLKDVFEKSLLPLLYLCLYLISKCCLIYHSQE
jgi:hypothetical protein